MTFSRCSWSVHSFLPWIVGLPHTVHLARLLAPAERNADMAFFLPAYVFLADARTVAANSCGISFAGIKSLLISLVGIER